MSALDNLQSSWNSFWQERSEQEQKILSLGAGVAGLALIYLLLLDPAISGRAQLQKELPKLQEQAALMASLLGEAQALAGRVAAPIAPMNKEMIEASLGQRGLKAQTIGMVGDQMKLQLNDVAFSNLMTWLDEMQKNSHISTLDANIVSQPVAGMVNATLTLRQQNAGQ